VRSGANASLDKIAKQADVGTGTLSPLPSRDPALGRRELWALLVKRAIKKSGDIRKEIAGSRPVK